MNLSDQNEHPNLKGLSPRSLLPPFILALACLSVLASICAHAEVPALLSYQGRIAVREKVFDGAGQFKLALINHDGSQFYWRNSADANNDGEPDHALSVPVTKGLYSITIGDTNLANMSALPAGIFANSSVYLRVWFNDGVAGFQLLNPDKRVASVGYALMAESIADGAISSAKLGSELAATINSLGAQLTDLTNRLQRVEDAAAGGSMAVSISAEDASLIAGGFQPFFSTPVTPWAFGSAEDVPAKRSGHTAIWTGNEMVIWGGYLGAETYANSGSSYDPGQDIWRTITTFGAPSARESHSAIWTGTEMIVWGGLGVNGYSDTGGRYQPTEQSWNAVSNVNAPKPRSDHACVWTGSEMIVWGGRGLGGYLADGASYQPEANIWTALTSTGAPEERHSTAAVWTGGAMVIWGGETAEGASNSGRRWVREVGGSAQHWETVSISGAPSARSSHTAVWTGTKVIVWGGRNGPASLGDGALYDPVADNWTPLPNAGAPSARSGHVAVWTGTEMLVYGGKNSSGALSSGGAYDPARNSWRPLNSAGNPAARAGAKAIWSGKELIVFGGLANSQPVADLQRLNPQPAWHLYRKL